LSDRGPRQREIERHRPTCAGLARKPARLSRLTKHAKRGRMLGEKIATKIPTPGQASRNRRRHRRFVPKSCRDSRQTCVALLEIRIELRRRLHTQSRQLVLAAQIPLPAKRADLHAPNRVELHTDRLLADRGVTLPETREQRERKPVPS